MCSDLMQEMFWEKHPTAIKMYSIKKHMHKIPALKNKQIANMTKNDYDELKTSKWAEMLSGKRPAEEALR